MKFEYCMQTKCKNCRNKLICDILEMNTMKKMRCRTAFFDVEAKQERKENETFTASAERAIKLFNVGLVEILGDVVEEATPIQKIEKAITKTIKKDSKNAKK